MRGESLARGDVRRSPPKREQVCEWCGERFMRRELEAEHYYCSGRCRAGAYQEVHARGDWLLMRVLERAYKVMQEAGINFEMEVDMGGYPGRKALRAEWNQFEEWVRRFAVGAGPAVKRERSSEREEENDEHP